MKNILEELWFGNIYPAEDALKMTTEMKDLGRLVERNRELYCRSRYSKRCGERGN